MHLVGLAPLDLDRLCSRLDPRADVTPADVARLLEVPARLLAGAQDQGRAYRGLEKTAHDRRRGWPGPAPAGILRAMESSRLRVASAQLDCRLGQPAENLDKHLAMIAKAREQGVDVLLFPETSLTGFPHRPADDKATVHRNALREGSPVFDRIAETAGDMVVVCGFVEEAPAAQFYNACAAVTRDGIVYLHRKLNLATYGQLEEGKYFAQGRCVDAFPIGGDGSWTASTLTCADVWNPALVHLAALHGATLLLVPINSAEGAVSSEFSNPAGWDLVSRFYAMIYGMPLVLANRVGNEAGLGFWGGSRIVDPFGNVLAEASRDEEALIVADLDYDAVREARIQLPTVRDSNLALVHREISRIYGTAGAPLIARPRGRNT